MWDHGHDQGTNSGPSLNQPLLTTTHQTHHPRTSSTHCKPASSYSARSASLRPPALSPGHSPAPTGISPAHHISAASQLISVSRSGLRWAWPWAWVPSHTATSGSGEGRGSQLEVWSAAWEAEACTPAEAAESSRPAIEDELAEVIVSSSVRWDPDAGLAILILAVGTVSSSSGLLG